MSHLVCESTRRSRLTLTRRLLSKYADLTAKAIAAELRGLPAKARPLMEERQQSPDSVKKLCFRKNASESWNAVLMRAASANHASKRADPPDGATGSGGRLSNGPRSGKQLL